MSNFRTLITRMRGVMISSVASVSPVAKGRRVIPSSYQEYHIKA